RCKRIKEGKSKYCWQHRKVGCSKRVSRTKLKCKSDLNIKFRENMSYHILIYGVTAKTVNNEVISPFNKYSLPMYGNSTKGEVFIGYEYDRINGLYDIPRTTDSCLQLSSKKVPGEIKKQFKELYPDSKPKTYALIQNVYTSHYADGKIMFGYWVNVANDN